MAEIRIDPRGDVSQWWDAVADCREKGLTADDAHWRVDDVQQDLFSMGPSTEATTLRPSRSPAEPIARPHDACPRVEVSADLRHLIDLVLLHSDPARFALAHRLVEMEASRPRLLHDHSDIDVARARAMEKSVRRDMHKMKAFVRFRMLEDTSGRETYVAWFEPEHHIVEAVAPFFVRRFASMRWSILTPEVSVHWDLSTLAVGPGAKRTDAPGEDPVESIWKSYYANIFNPARLKVKAMTSEMPKKYWRNLPEAELISDMVRNAGQRETRMIAAAPTTPAPKTRVRTYRPAEPAGSAVEPGEMVSALADMPAAINACRRCSLHCNATQGVPGEGPSRARLMIVGEQPGDQEDLAGRAFVGPAGRVLDEALKRVGIPRETAFVTNAVKHFKFEPRGKRRIHKKPDVSEIEACRWWLDQERGLVKPALIVALGATAARAITGRTAAGGAQRGRVMQLDDGGAHVLVTVHPSYLLRLREEDDKRREWRSFLDDLTIARDWLATSGGG